MGIFGWSYPPGCNSVPGDEIGAVDITSRCAPLPAGVVGVFWDEDGNIIEQRLVIVPEDEHAGIPEYDDVAERKVGELEYDDLLDDDANNDAAAAAYNKQKVTT